MSIPDSFLVWDTTVHMLIYEQIEEFKDAFTVLKGKPYDRLRYSKMLIQ